MSTNVLNAIELPERYELDRHLATGGMASVWSAHDRVLGRQVAVKVLAEQFHGEQAAALRFKREARTQARLSGHPHIVQIFDVSGPAPTPKALVGQSFIVMEYLAGGTVADAIRVGAVDRDQALRWLREAASALDYAHRAGVVHRDIKPSNFLLDRDRVLRVGDFGIAREASEDTLTGTDQLFGTAAYISPEQVLGLPATAASDRYAFAVTAFELLVGERPFTAQHAAAQARQHLEEERPRASERKRSLPRRLDPVLTRGLAKNPKDRWPTATSFVTAVEDALGGARRPAPVAAPSDPVVTAYRGGDSRWRTGALAALAGVALAVGLITGAGSDSRSGRVAHLSSHAAAPPPARGSAQTAKPKPSPSAAGASQVAQGDRSKNSATTDPAALQARGHQLMQSGNYQAAIGVLRQALSAASPSSTTYAYALYDLGRSLRLAGDPQAAIPVLQQRLQIPNQTDVVRRELALAGGPGSSQSGGAPIGGSGKHKGHGKDNGNHNGGGGGGD